MSRCKASTTIFPLPQPTRHRRTYLLGTAYIRSKQVEKGQLLVDRILRKGDSPQAHMMMGTAFAEAQDDLVGFWSKL